MNSTSGIVVDSNDAVMTNDGQDHAVSEDAMESDTVEIDAIIPHRPLAHNTAPFTKPVLTRRRSKSSVRNNTSSSYDQISQKGLQQERQVERRGVRFGDTSTVEFEACASFCPREELWFTAEEYQGIRSSIRKAITTMSLQPSRFKFGFGEDEDGDECYRGIEFRREKVHQRRAFLADFIHIHRVMNIRDPETLGLICVQKTYESIRDAHDMGRMDAMYAQRLYREEEAPVEDEENKHNINNFFCEEKEEQSSLKPDTSEIMNWPSPSLSLSYTERKKLMVDRMTSSTIALPPLHNPQQAWNKEETGEHDGCHRSDDDYCQDDDCWWILTNGLGRLELNPSKKLACTDLEQSSTIDSVSKTTSTAVTTTTNTMEPYAMMISRNNNVDEVPLSFPTTASLPVSSVLMSLVFQCILTDSSP